jgi:AbrB family looped-hinge helix DNA binding protein
MNQMKILKVDSRGRITFPKILIERLGWHDGDLLLFKEVNGGILVQRVKRATK